MEILKKSSENDQLLNRSSENDQNWSFSELFVSVDPKSAKKSVNQLIKKSGLIITHVTSEECNVLGGCKLI